MLESRLKNLTSYLLFSLAVLGLCYSNLHKEIITIIVEKKSITSSLFFSSLVTPLSLINVKSPVNGTVVKKYFNYGQQVKKNDLLLTINSKELAQDFRAAIVEWLKVKATYQQAQFQQQGTTSLYKMGLISKLDYLTQQGQLNDLSLSLFQAEQKLQTFLQQAGMTTLKLNELSLTKQPDVQAILSKPIHDFNLAAPDNGVVLFPSNALAGGSSGSQTQGQTSTKLDEGSEVKTGQSLVLIGDMSGVSFDINVNESDFNDIKIGQPATITGVSFNGITLHGRVTNISYQANSANYGGLQTYAAHIIVPRLMQNERKIIEIGMSAEIELIKEMPPAIIVPIKAVFQTEGKQWVNLFDRETQMSHPVPVVTGKTTEDSVQIISGIKPGDEIVLSH